MVIVRHGGEIRSMTASDALSRLLDEMVPPAVLTAEPIGRQSVYRA
jgi:hypothetical protein